MFQKAVVRMYGQTAGHLYRTDQGYRFEYEVGYPYAPISISIPVREKPYEWGALPPAFEALAPEGWMRKCISVQEHIDEQNSFEMLCRYGQDLIGAIEIEGLK